MREIHDKKSSDYAASSNSYENFERAAQVASWFKYDIDKVFAILITVKLARLATLLNSDREPNNESIDDSHLDETIYSALWASYRMSKSNIIRKMLEEANVADKSASPSP